MGRMINGFILIDVPWSALNNAGVDAGERTDNTVKVKVIRKGRNFYPYVSGQALRYWWRDTLEKRFRWKLSPVEKIKGKNQAVTSANPIEYDDDDMFGYMRAAKEEVEEGGKTKKKDVTVTRISPLKNSPLVSIVPQSPISDFGVMARQKEGDPVPYEHEFYSSILKGIFSVDLNLAGVFCEIEKSGYQNMSPKMIKLAKEKGLIHDENARMWKLPQDIRKKRIKDVILALPYLSGGAKLTEHLTDVSPKFIVLAVIEGGNNIFMNIASEQGINFKALSSVIEDYKESILSDVYIARREGFLDEMEQELTEFSKKEWEIGKRKIKVIRDSINNTVVKFTGELDNHID